MANPITLTIGTISLTAIPFSVTGRSATDNLVNTDVKIKKLNGSTFSDFTAFTLASGATATAATITPNSALVQGDLLLIQINDGAQVSDRVSVDFSESYAGNDAITPFLMPDEAGTYTFKVQTVNGDAFAVNSSSFTVGPAPLPANSSIALNSKSYLVKYVGTQHDVKIVLNNADGDASEGNYEVIFKADKS